MAIPIPTPVIEEKLDDPKKIELELADQIRNLRLQMRNIRQNKNVAQTQARDTPKAGPSKSGSAEPVPKPRIISDVQLVPPPGIVGDSPVVGSTEWTLAQSKKAKNKAKKQARRPSEKITPQIAQEKPKQNSGRSQSTARTPKQKTTRKPPRTAAVAIKVLDKRLTYSEVMRKVREKVQLSELGIDKTKIRYAANGDALIEIPGSQNAEKAERLKTKLSELLGEHAKVSRSMIKGDLRISGFDDSVSPSEIAETIAEIGVCSPKDIKIGEIRKLRNNLCTVWLQCPLVAAVKVSGQEKIKLGWTIARIALLKARPIRCYKCWKLGHLRNNCTSQIDRASSCYNCGMSGHSARVCDTTAACVLCREAELPCDHRLGSANCKADEINSKNRNKSNSKVFTQTQSARRAEQTEMDYE